jgi:MFS-type transporter involved in bile tolerance (Atg22 family)
MTDTEGTTKRKEKAETSARRALISCLIWADILLLLAAIFFRPDAITNPLLLLLVLIIMSVAQGLIHLDASEEKTSS